VHLRGASRPEGPTPTTPHDTDAAVNSSAPPAGRNQTCTKTRVRRGSPALPLPRQPPEDEGPDATTPARRIGFEIQKRALRYCSERNGSRLPSGFQPQAILSHTKCRCADTSIMQTAETCWHSAYRGQGAQNIRSPIFNITPVSSHRKLATEDETIGLRGSHLQS
jgi:hypothetical protein